MTYLVCKSCASIIEPSELEYVDGYECPRDGCQGAHFRTIEEVESSGQCPRCNRDEFDSTSMRCGYCGWPQNNDGTWPPLAKEVVIE